MLYNVAQLLKAPIGATRQYTLDEPFGPVPDHDIDFSGDIQGEVQLTRVNHGIVVDAHLHAPITLECSRCLRLFAQDLDLSFAERFIPTIDVLSGLPSHEPEEDEDDEDVYPIDAHHQIDLHEAIRQQAVINRPMQPLHAAECAGLCATCGVDRNEQVCGCDQIADGDPRLAGLLAWQPRRFPTT